MFECFYTVYLFLSIYRKWTNDLNRRYDPAVAGNNKILYKREHLGLVQCIVIFSSDQLTHLIQVNFNSLQWVILGQTPTGVEPNEGALRLLHDMCYVHNSNYCLNFINVDYPNNGSKAKLTLKEEGRIFNEEWGMQYFLVLNKDRMCCLLCDATISCMKKYNAKLHYETHEKHKHFQLEGEKRKIAFERLKNQKERQQQMFKKISCPKNDAFEATYRVVLLLGKRGKPFSDVDIIKEQSLKLSVAYIPRI